ncbi:MAG: FG-GAP-like repeat-containing protein [Flavobacteriales bacterium]
MFDDIQTSHNVQSWGSGISFFDINEDGWDDITIVQDTNAYLTLYMGSPIGFIEVTTDIFIDGHAKAAMWIDIDNDGDNDLIVSFIDSATQVFRHDSTFHFTNVSISLGFTMVHDQYYGLGAGDIDNNGYLDIYVCNYSKDYPNVFYLSDSLGFTESGVSAGVDDSLKVSFSSMFADFDHDGLIDIYVVNDHSEGNQLYLNNGDSTFTPATSGLNIGLNGMGIAHTDINHDGFLDLIITNTNDNAVLSSSSTGTYTLDTGTYFIDSSTVSWGCVFFDPDLDMDSDLFVASGEVYANVPYHSNLFYENYGDTFLELNTTIYNAPANPTYAAAHGDFNADGLPDLLYQNSAPGKIELYKNTTATENHWLRLMLAGSVSNRNAFGAIVIAYQGNVARKYWSLSTESYLSQNSQFLSISSGDTCGFDSIQIYWPMPGSDTTLYGVECDQTIKLFESGLAYPVPAIQLPDGKYICSGSPVSLTVAGHYTSLIWSTGSTDDTITTSLAGTYSVTVTNQFGQTSVAIPVQIGSVLKPSFEVQVKKPTCFDAKNGSIEAIPNAGQSQITYLWNNGKTIAKLNNLDTGVYSVKVTNHWGCSRTRIINLDQPDSISIDFITTNLHCHNDSSGSILLNVSGGTPPYAYYWQDGAFTQMRSSLLASTYSVKVTDLLSCSNTGLVGLTQPEQLGAQLEIQKPDSSIDEWHVSIVPEGGTPPHFFSWSHSIKSHSDTAIIKKSGLHQATVRDAHDCSHTINFDLNDSISIINEIHASNDMEIWYPNPSHGVLSSNNKNVSRVELYTVYGQLVGRFENVNQLQIPVGIENQFYLVVSYIDHGVYVQRMLVH